LAAGFVVVAACAGAEAPTPIPQQFEQEYAEGFTTKDGLPDGGVQLVEPGSSRTPRVFAGGSWWELSGGRWSEVGKDWRAASAEEFVFPDREGRPVHVAIPWKDVIQIVHFERTSYVVTAADPFTVVDGKLSSMGWPSRLRVNQLAVSQDGVVFLASSGGLFRRVANGWQGVRATDEAGRIWSAGEVLGVALDGRQRLWIATKAGVGCRTGDLWKFYEGKDGLPWNEFTGIAGGRGDDVWFGTRVGAIRWDGQDFLYRQGPQWLPHDEVRRIGLDAGGGAWFATAGGLGHIAHRPMTLAEKATFYEGEVARYVKRTPLGYVDQAPLRAPADKSSANPHDSDNDGLWTAMYGAGECLGYAATKDPKIKERAKQAFEALRFLQKVTQGGPHSPPPGYIARTIRPVDWPDPNIGRIESDREEAKRDQLWKVYEPRWPKSADGKWYWKSDTSSDELDGHYFFHSLYFDFCADTDAEKERVREVVRGLTDHLISHDFTLVDHDGKPTRWGVYGPQFLNQDPRWWPERGLNSLSILTYLAVAEHVTGDAKYARASRELIDRHGYAHNLMYAKVQHGPGSGNQSDDEMAFMCYYGLLRCSKDDTLKAMTRYSFFRYWANEAPEMNPFFNFAYAAHALNESVSNVWGRFPLAPWPGWLEDSRATLQGFSLDRLDWPHRNSHRLDVVSLSQQRAVDLYAPRSRGRGQRVNGKVVPVENRHFEHWNTDPWRLDYDGNGQVLASATVFLLPYYLGVYHGFIEKPAQ
jgi:hypothetical protein